MCLINFRKALASTLLISAMGVNAAGSVSGDIQAYVVNKANSSEEIISAASEAEPGDVIEYRLVFTNSGESDVFGLNVVNPIPENTSFVADSASTQIPSTFQVSIDGGSTFESTPVTRIETQADGTQKKVVIPPSQYTHVRWTADKALPAEGEHVYAYRVLID